jgi:hypothetical protein
MATQTIEPVRTRSPAAASGIVAWLGAAAFVIGEEEQVPGHISA